MFIYIIYQLWPESNEIEWFGAYTTKAKATLKIRKLRGKIHSHENYKYQYLTIKTIKVE